MGGILGLPVHHIDCHFLKPNWQPTDKTVVAAEIEKITHNDEWIIEGNYKLTLANRFEKSDKIIYLNLPFDDCIESIKQRHHSNEKRVGIPEYLEITEERLPELIEKISQPGWYDDMHRLAKVYKDKVVELKSRKEIDEYIEKLQRLIHHGSPHDNHSRTPHIRCHAFKQA